MDSTVAAVEHMALLSIPVAKSNTRNNCKVAITVESVKIGLITLVWWISIRRKRGICQNQRIENMMCLSVSLMISSMTTTLSPWNIRRTTIRLCILTACLIIIERSQKITGNIISQSSSHRISQRNKFYKELHWHHRSRDRRRLISRSHLEGWKYKEGKIWNF